MKWVISLVVALAATMSLGAGVAQANVAPTISAPAHIAATEDTSVDLNEFTFSDPDASGDDVETITLSVDSGWLSAVWGYVTTTGQWTSRLTMRGSLSELQFMFQWGEISYRDFNGASGARTLHVTIDDEGNSGGGPLTASADVPLDVAAVNDAPSISAPSTPALSVDQNGSLAFTGPDPVWGFGTLDISASDSDDAGGVERMRLSASHGTLTLTSTSGLSFSAGDGTSDAAMTFDGTLDDINAAVAGLVYRPSAGYAGPDELLTTVDDLGNTGSGGPQIRTAATELDVESPTPYVTGIRAPMWDDGTLARAGTSIPLLVQFSRAITVTPTSHMPSLLLNTGPVQRRAEYFSRPSADTLLFTYTVQPGDSASVLDVASASALDFDAGAITGASNGIEALAATPLGTDAGSLAAHRYEVDGDEAYVTGVDVPRAGRYGAGSALDVKVRFDRPVTVSGGTPALEFDGGLPYAWLVAGSGTDTLTFRHTVAAGESATEPTLDNHIHLFGARIVAGTRTNPLLVWDRELPLTGVTVDGVAPSTMGMLHARDLTWTVAFSEPVTGVDPSDFDIVTAGTAAARAIDVAPVGDTGSIYRVTLSNTSGSGTIAPRLKAAGTGIADLAGNALSGAGATGPQWALPVPARPVPTQPGTSTRPAATPATAKPSLRTATIASSCTKAKTLTLTFAGRGAARVEVKVVSLKASAKQHGCSGLAALKTGRAVGAAKRLTIRSGTNHIKYRHGLKPGAYVVTFTPIAADGTRGTALTRRIRILK